MKDLEMLFARAKKSSETAYAPYSKYKVGAAVLTDCGRVFVGCNVENVSYGATICAERVAVSSAIAAGYRGIKAVAVFNDRGDIVPCGVCLQFMSEFGIDIDVIFQCKNQLVSKRIKDLMPYAFDRKYLEPVKGRGDEAGFLGFSKVLG